MNKQDLVAAIANELKANLKDVEPVVDALSTVVTKALVKGDEVSLHGLGKLKVALRKARTGRNPSTGEEIQIPAKNQAVFVVSKTLKDALNAG
ncbi:MAG: HU family DNA-binding protein [Methylophilus sp.]